ncbi:TIGR04076 family protein [Candidatus Bipolaricaulota bacterium]
MNARITVMKRAFHKDMIDQYFPEYAKKATPCPVFEDGQVFKIKGIFPSMPEGFCDWAWADIQRNVAMACMGATMPSGCQFTCCSDGLRPVTFRIEAIEDPEA